MRARIALAVAFLSNLLAAQTAPHNGPRPVDPGWYALTGARVVVAAGNSVDGLTLVVRDRRIAAIDRSPPPAGATVIDCSGLTIYPGLIDPFVPTDVPALPADTTDQHWNPMIQPQRRALDGALVPAAEREALRRLGFTTVACVPTGGILKGTSCVVQLDEPSPTAPAQIVRGAAYVLASLQTQRSGYPDSEMGAIALLRQTLADAQWYARCRATPGTPPPPSAALQALVDHAPLPLWFDVQDELQALRALRIAAEFQRTPVLVGSGMEFRRVAALAAARAPIVVPLQLPDAPDVGTAAAAERVSLRQLQTWEQAPTNSKRLLDAGVEIAWTTARLRDRRDFFARVRDAMHCGVTAVEALHALTTRPAGLLGIGDQVGSIERGKLANLVVVAGELFDEDAEIRDVWVGGVRHVVKAPADDGIDGTWSWTAGWPGPAAPAPVVTIAGDQVRCKVGDDELKTTHVERGPDHLSCRLAGTPLGADAHWLRLYRAGDELAGVRTAPDGTSQAVRGQRQTAVAAPPARRERAQRPPPPSLAPLPTPLGGYGRVEPPAAADFVLVGATLWTGDAQGIVPGGAVYVRGGRIAYAGPADGLPPLPPDLLVVDGTGKHLTPGLIDCHSHTGISRGVNESGEAVTAEVRIEDVIDPDDVNWYRQLAGGVTTVNQLHGSANAIGGQSCTTKIRFGVLHPDEMRLQGAPAGIKWALGENPRRANSGGANSRYPNTRMGVEALLRDRFAAAAAYRQQQAAYEALAPVDRARQRPPRRDLELEAIAEVLAGTRRIHCHSYRQDEIFMLCGLAREHGIRIGTFQHVLEGYKVADAIAEAAIGASSFSDWWAYKFEVWDAIPDNGALMHEAGVCVSFNSDSNEHARRLNTEAGKAVKYGGVAPAEALCFVTRNPAIQLGIDDRTGTLTAGKDADLALWSADPLGYAARCEATWVDGRQLFSLEQDQAARAAIARERQRLLQLAAAAPKGRTAREGDRRDAYWAAEDSTEDYCCRECEGGAR